MNGYVGSAGASEMPKSQNFAALDAQIAEYSSDTDDDPMAPYMRSYFCDSVILPALYDGEISYDEASTLLGKIGVEGAFLTPEDKHQLLAPYCKDTAVRVFVTSADHFGQVNGRIADEPVPTLMPGPYTRGEIIAVISALNIGIVLEGESGDEIDWAPYTIRTQTATDGSTVLDLIGIKPGHSAASPQDSLAPRDT